MIEDSKAEYQEMSMPAPPIGSWWRNEFDTGVMQVVGHHPDGWHMLCVDHTYGDPKPHKVLLHHFERAARYDACFEEGHLVYQKRPTTAKDKT